MKTLKQVSSLVGVFIMISALSGCLESTDVTIFEPGVYQGAVDPLIGSTDAAALQSRFQKQMDR